MTFYKLKVKMKKTVVAAAKYKHKRFLKGRTYEVRRKLTPEEVKILRKNYSDYKILSVKSSVKRS